MSRCLSCWSTCWSSRVSVSPESEQGASTKRALLPCLTGVHCGTGMEPEFILRPEPGYEQCRCDRDITDGSRTVSYHERLLLLHGLEAAVTELGGGVDELEVDLLQSTTARLHQQRLRGSERKPGQNRTNPETLRSLVCRNIDPAGTHLTQSQHPLLCSHDAALHHDKVVGHLSVVDEATLKTQREHQSTSGPRNIWTRHQRRQRGRHLPGG